MKKLSTPLIVFILLISTSCQKENYELGGNIVGFVQLYDELGNAEELNQGVVVSIANSDYECITDDYGRYEFKDLIPGSYRINYNKVDYSSFSILSYQFVGGNMDALINPQSMFRIPEVTFSNLNVKIEDQSLIITGNAEFESEFSVIAYVSKTSDVTEFNYLKQYHFNSHFFSNSSTINISQNIVSSQIQPGDKLYVVLFVNNSNFSMYWDLYNGVAITEVIELVY